MLLRAGGVVALSVAVGALVLVLWSVMTRNGTSRAQGKAEVEKPQTSRAKSKKGSTRKAPKRDGKGKLKKVPTAEPGSEDESDILH